MHIPDGYLSPATSVTLYSMCVPFMAKASKETKRKLNDKTVPLISLFSALSFVIMMFNVPLPGGTTGHAVGATITAIVLGPWIAMLSLTVALVIQALFFGDGGILALGANVFNMVIVMTLSGYFIYQILDRWSKTLVKRKVIFSAVAGYISINLAALCTAVELGIQPLLFHNNLGQSLYFPYGLNVSIPSMLIGHLTIAGFAEALVTGLILSWIYKTNPGIMTSNMNSVEKNYPIVKWGLIALGVLVILSPLGLLAPGTAWGEWGRIELEKLGLGYIPQGFDKWSNFWKAPLSQYNLPQSGNPTIGYMFSGFIGVFMTILVLSGTFWIMRRLSKNNILKVSKKPGKST